MKDIRVDIINEGDKNNGYVKVSYVIKLLLSHSTDLQKKIEGLRKEEGRHDGHSNDNRSWCYSCDQIAPEEEFTENGRYNAALQDVLTLLQEEAT